MANKQQIAVLSAVVFAAGVGAYWLTQHSQRSTSRATPERIAFLQEKLVKKQNRRLERFDQPAEAMQFAVDKRTGTIVTRGPGANQPSGRFLSPAMYRAALDQARQMPVFSSSNRSLNPPAPPGGLLGTWSELGPTNQGGRTRQLLIDPTNPNTMFAAAVGGGVWKSTNGGATWTVLTDLLIPNIAVNSLAFQPNNTQVLYAGTGEGFFNLDGIRGAGIFKTTDGGTTWTQLASTDNSNFHYVTDIVVSPRNVQRVYATTRTGVYRSNDGGATWTALGGIIPNNGCLDLAMQMKRSTGFVFAACGTFAQGRVYRALDTPTSNFAEVFSTANQGRTSLAIAPSNEGVIYALATSTAAGNYNNGLLGVFRSVSNGNSGSWTTQVLNTNANKLNTVMLSNPVFAFLNDCGFGASNQFFNQGWYDNVIAVDPTDSNRVWAGGIDMMRSDDGGATWGLASYWWFGQGDPNYAHADHHAVTFHPQYDGVGNRTMYIANDGGIFRTGNAQANLATTLPGICGTPPAGMVTWTELNTDYTTMQFYHGTAYPAGDFFFGGTQDNGTWRGAPASTVWTNLLGGDGGYTAVDTLGDANAANDVLFGEFTRLSLQRSTNGGATFANSFSGITESGNNFLFIAPFDMNRGNRQHLWMGGWFIWRTINQATSWVRASDITAGNGSIASVAANPSNADKVIVGMSDGFIHYSATALTDTSTTDWPSTQPRAAYVSSLAWDPNNQDIAYATFSSFTGPATVYRSVNSGATWTAIQGAGITALPLVPAHSIVVDPGDSNRLYVGTDIGVFTSLDSGATWYRENTGFANVQVEWLDINSTGTRRLHAFTHGRGAWRVDLVP